MYSSANSKRTAWKLLWIVQLCVVVKTTVRNKRQCFSSVFCQHSGCMVQTCCVLGFKKLFVLHTTSPKNSRWPSRLNRNQGTFTASVLGAEILLFSRFVPSSTCPLHGRETIQQSRFFIVKAPQYLGCGWGNPRKVLGIPHDTSSLAQIKRQKMTESRAKCLVFSPGMTAGWKSSGQ